MADITIRHTQEDGTLIEGSAKGDGVYELLRGLYGNWRYFPSLRQIGIGQSRYKAPKTGLIETAAEALRQAGHTVTVAVDTERTMTTAQVEQARYDAAEDRADRLTSRAASAAGTADQIWEQNRQTYEALNGQPILVGHHSERGHRNLLDKLHNRERRAIEEYRSSKRLAARAAAAERYQARREAPGTTQRRIENLEAEARQIDRRVNGTGKAIHGEDTPATGSYRDQLLARAEEVAGELDYWREHMAKLEESGVKVWSKADFTRGDYVRFLGKWFEVLRVNGKSVTIPAMINDGLVITKAEARLSWTDTVPYHEVAGRKSAEEMAAVLADPSRRGELAI